MQKIIRVEPAERLLAIDYLEALADSVCNLRMPRRDVPNLLADMIFGWLEAGGEFVDEHGVALNFGPEVVDEVHGQDGSFRVISSMMAYSVTPRQRRGRVTTLARLRVYDAAFKAGGVAVLPDTRRIECEKMRDILRNFQGVWRVRYLREVKRLRRVHHGDKQAGYGLAIHLLRLRFAAEQAAWKQHQAM